MIALDPHKQVPHAAPPPHCPVSAARAVPATEGIMARLKRATQAEHQAVERSPVLACLMAPGLTLEAYGTALSRLYGFHASAEPSLSARLAEAPRDVELAVTPRAGLLVRDLQWLGLAAGGLAVAPRLERLRDWRMAAGALYVLEGSRLGGRVIARKLSDSIGLTADAGAAFFATDSAEACRNDWFALSRCLETLAADAGGQIGDPGRADAIVAGAVVAFRALAQWIAADEQPAVDADKVSSAVATVGENTWPTR